MGKKSRRKAAARFVKICERDSLPYQVPPDVGARIERRTQEIVRERRIVPNSDNSIESVAHRLALLDLNLEETVDAFHQAVKLGQSRPVVAILDVRDNLAGKIFATVTTERHLDDMRRDAGTDTTPVVVVSMSRDAALKFITDACPRTAAILEEADPVGTFPIACIAEAGIRLAYIPVSA